MFALIPVKDSLPMRDGLIGNLPKTTEFLPNPPPCDNFSWETDVGLLWFFFRCQICYAIAWSFESRICLIFGGLRFLKVVI